MNALASPIESNVVPRADLSAAWRDEMFALLNEHFDGVTRAQFDSDLAAKNFAIVIHQHDRLVGFSTLLAFETRHNDQPVSVIYSGDTIMSPCAWRSTMLPRTWIAAVNELRREYSRGRYYWLLLTSGFRTYRFLPVFWREFFPRFDAVTPPATQELIHHLAREKFGPEFDAARGIVRFQRPQQLRPALSGIPPARRLDPHVQFFARRNPGHVRGDELVCLTELTPENLTAAGQRMVRG